MSCISFAAICGNRTRVSQLSFVHRFTCISPPCLYAFFSRRPIQRTIWKKLTFFFNFPSIFMVAWTCSTVLSNESFRFVHWEFLLIADFNELDRDTRFSRHFSSNVNIPNESSNANLAEKIKMKSTVANLRIESEHSWLQLQYYLQPHDSYSISGMITTNTSCCFT